MRHTALVGALLAAFLLVACQGGAASSAPSAAGAPSVAPSSEPPAASADPTPLETPPAVGVATGMDGPGHLVSPEGMTLYVFLNDAPGMSHCIGTCAESWPPFLTDGAEPPAAVADVTGELGTIDRGGGEFQVTLDGWPLYFYAGDSAPGDTNGDGVGDVWYLARPDGSVPGAGASEEPEPYY